MNEFNYFISGVWKDSERITHVMLHKALDNGSFLVGEKKSEQEVIKLLKQNKRIRVIIWDYPGWLGMAEVEYVKGKDKEFLRTNRNKTDKDNLDNLILMHAFFN
ncbi:DUF3892 domain-containing protein [Cloacibacterium normanense]|uniref:DUF3892 domain-containing protein n=1 Tax=Cloacibacterium normanense TaxID=237258 RepID=UPI00391DD848